MGVGRIVSLLLILFMAWGCAPKIKLFSDATSPLAEYTVQGQGKEKIALINLNGFLDDKPSTGLLRSRPGAVQEMVSQLRRAAKDKAVKAVVIKINSPGGTVTASDILYQELMQHREKTGQPIVALMMDVAASGGYYAALAADAIIAHPTTITGSVGVIFVRPKVVGLMDKLGVEVNVSKSGADKDMGSPFIANSKKEEELFQGVIDDMAQRFYTLVETRRHPDRQAMKEIRTARIFTASRAKELGLIDAIGYMDKAFDQARALAKLTTAQVVVYRRDHYPDDNPYNTMSTTPAGQVSLLNVGATHLLPPKAGLYYLWNPGW